MLHCCQLNERSSVLNERQSRRFPATNPAYRKRKIFNYIALVKLLVDKVRSTCFHLGKRPCMEMDYFKKLLFAFASTHKSCLRSCLQCSALKVEYLHSFNSSVNEQCK